MNEDKAYCTKVGLKLEQHAVLNGLSQDVSAEK